MRDGFRLRAESWSDFRTRSDAILDALPLGQSQTMTIDSLCAAIEQQHGRRLHLSPLPKQAGAAANLCGLWVRTGHTDHIFYETSTSTFHQRHIILHEISHLLLDHTTDRHGGTLPGMESLFPDLDPTMVRRLLARGRTDYSELQELQAELMATLIHQRSTDHASHAVPTAHKKSESLDRLARALGLVHPR
ncbi:hypothetical protein [Streptomyces indiaensis]|uniref:IrrE N-terminal-like domain-containing protein n=1 Tax=Streptomyces indiaensis TaxID=284033 RepID=A0ABN3DFU4_9ACTN|nr:hypothetical protein [Streptomyces indiaensis]MCF1644553.1 hypothetical protein [Streptomyces indiaensis]